MRALTLLGGCGLPVLLLGVGLCYLFALRAFPILHPIRTLKLAFRGRMRSSLRALSVALGGTLGVGNITGVALALAMGGAGAVFWMWISAAVAMFLKYGEIVLALISRKRGADGTWEGGAMYYLKKGRAFGRWAATLFALLCLLCALTLGAPVQSNAAAVAAHEVLGIPPYVTGALLLFLTAIAVLGGIRRIADFTERVVPIVSVLYLLLSLYAVFANLSALGGVFFRIFREAFSFSAGASGVGGFFASRALRYGVTRGLLSNEAGAGTAPMAHAVAENTPASQGVMGFLEVAVDTFVFCTATALPLLIAYDGAFPALSGVGLVTGAFSALVGHFAPPLLSVSLFLFAYATVLAWFYYGKRAIGYLTENPMAQKGYVFVYVVAVGCGAILREGVLWELTDGVISLLTMLHTACLLPLLPTVVCVSRAEGFLGNGIHLGRDGERQCVQGGAKVLRDGRKNGDGGAVRGMRKTKPCGVEHGARKAVTLPAIQAVAREGMTDRRKMQADLVGAPRFRKDGDE